MNKRTEALQFSRSHRDLAEKIVEYSLDGILVTNQDGVIESVNPAFTEMMGYSSEEIIGKTPSIFNSGRHEKAFHAEMWRMLKSVGSWQGEIWNRHKNGSIRPQFLTISSIPHDPGIPNETGDSHCFAAFYRDISAIKKSEEAVKKLAFHDALTGLPNRRVMEHRLDKRLATASRRHKFGTLLFIDLDHFKPVNDSLGHAVGDLLLIQVAKRLSQIVREEDTVARFGGDEFAVLLPDLGLAMDTAVRTTQTVAEKIQGEIQRPYHLKGHHLNITSSIGIAMFPIKNHTHYKAIIHQADTAMYRAKKSKQKIRFYDQQIQTSMETRAKLEEELRSALLEGQFCLYYQPQVDGRGGLVGVEALLRWHHPERGLITPSEFMTAENKSALAPPLGAWVLGEACRQAKKWASLDIPFRQLSINISAHQFLQSDFVEQTKKIIEETGIDPRSLVFEITEKMIFNRIDASEEKMKVLAEYGIQFALDDFGSGRSSLVDLKRLPLHKVKIDRKYVQDLHQNIHHEIIIQAIISVAKIMQFEVIAGGVESLDQLKHLQTLGCRYFQGERISQPIPSEALPQFIHKKTCANDPGGMTEDEGQS